MISTSDKQTMKIRCPQCLNYMIVTLHNEGSFSGNCKACKSRIFSKQHTRDIRHIKIVRMCS